MEAVEEKIELKKIGKTIQKVGSIQLKSLNICKDYSHTSVFLKLQTFSLGHFSFLPSFANRRDKIENKQDQA